MNDLSNRIYAFINKYAAISPNWDGESYDEKYTSPDVYEMLYCADILLQNKKPDRCFSEWGCGGYIPYTSWDGRNEHDGLIVEIYTIIKG